MAVIVSYNGSAVVNGVDLTDHAKRIYVTQNQETRDVTAHGSSARFFRAGLSVPTAEVDLFGDNASGSVNSTLRALVTIASTGFLVALRKSNSASTTVNPVYNLTAIIDGDVGVLSEEIGEVQMVNVKFTPYSTLTVNTSAT